jgi:hypothetical protein
MTNGNGSALEKVAQIAEATKPTDSESASVLKHVESIFERAVHMQTEPLQRLIEQAQQMVNEQFDHLARIKGEAAILFRNGQTATEMADALRRELDAMRSRHSESINAQTR